MVLAKNPIFITKITTCTYDYTSEVDITPCRVCGT